VGATERWYFVRDGQLWKHTELDGTAFLFNPDWHVDEPLCSVAEAETRYPAQLARARTGG